MPKKRAKLPLKSILFKKVYDYIDGAIKIVFRRYFVANRPIHNSRDNRFSGKAGKMHKLYRLQFKAAFVVYKYFIVNILQSLNKARLDIMYVVRQNISY